MKKYLLLLAACLLLSACQSQKEEKPAISTPETEKVTVAITTETEKADVESQEPPTPPLLENFQATPQLSLFPRAGAFRPEDDDEKGLQFWRTFIDHLIRTSGPVKTAEDNIAFGFRAIKGLDSVGVFSPIAVKPNTSYEVSTEFTCDLSEGATAGIGLLEFDEFMWIGEQYSESMANEHQIGSQQGISLSGKVETQKQTFTFITSPKTTMIHLVFFRDGIQDRNPILIDNIEIKETVK